MKEKELIEAEVKLEQTGSRLANVTSSGVQILSLVDICLCLPWGLERF